MAIIWQLDNDAGEWAARPLTGGDAFLLGERGIEPLPADPAGWAGVIAATGSSGSPAPARVVLRRYRSPAQRRPQWAMLAGSTMGIRANGERVRTGIRVLRDRDVVNLGPGREIVFSTEDLPLAGRVPADRIGSRCPRCTRPFSEEDVVVECPRCGSAHHAMDELGCWTHRPRCATCDCPTSGAAYTWTPDSL